MLRLTDFIARHMPLPEKQSDALILRMFGIGDALLFRMVLEKYAEAINAPLSQITVLGSEAWATAAKLFFSDVEVILIDERRFAKNFFYRLKIMRKIRKRGYHIAICGMRFRFPHVVESLILASNATHKIVAQARPNEKFDAMFAHYGKQMTHVVPVREPNKPRAGDGTPLPLMHEIEHQLAFLSTVAGKPIRMEALPRLVFPPSPMPFIKPNERYAILNIGASHSPRRWPLENYFGLARLLLEQGYSVVFLGGPAEDNLKSEIAAFSRQNLSFVPGTRIISAINTLSLAAATQLVNGAALVISNDSGIGHLSIMLEKPSVLIVGGGHFGSFMPYPEHLTRPNIRFLYHLMPCYHCNWNCTMMHPGEKTFPCVGRVSVDDVWRAVKEIT